jgi:sensor histidine kinase YesM
MQSFRQFIIGNRLTRHLLFCLGVLLLLSLGLYFLYVSKFSFERRTALINCLYFLFCIYTGRWLCQTWYLRGRYALFIVFSLAGLISLAVLEWLLVRYVFNHPNAGFLELIRGDVPFLLTGLVLGMLLKLISALMQKELLDARVRAEQKESELKMLQSQVSPHFLFNVLNNLYGISIEDHRRIPPLLLKLSSLLRYSVYGSRKLFVPLKEELEYVKTYIEFEQIRISDRLRLVTDIAALDDPMVKIAPQVLIVFVENAFKHSKNTLSPEIQITISVKISGNFILLEVENSFAADNGGDDMALEGSGLGLANTVKRLQLLYGKEYELKQEVYSGLYRVALRLKIITQDDRLSDRR